MKSLQEVTDYIWANAPNVRRWETPKFEKWVKWHFSQGWICLVLNFDESIAGLAMIRPVLLRDVNDPLAFDVEGDCLYVAQVISTGKRALMAVGFAVKERFGVRDYMAWQRPPDYKMQVHQTKDLRRNLFRMETVYGTTRHP